MKTINTIILMVILSILTGCVSIIPTGNNAKSLAVITVEEQKKNIDDYNKVVATWKSFKDVEMWMQKNYTFSFSRQDVIKTRIRNLIIEYGTDAWEQDGMLQNPVDTFRLKLGHCKDAAHFVNDALFKINPSYEPTYVFIKNRYGSPHHWVTGFTVDNKIFIFDYGAGPAWDSMNGIHGPYNSLDEYKSFLATLDIDNFYPEFVVWKH